jgi:hypothetical protein
MRHFIVSLFLTLSALGRVYAQEPHPNQALTPAVAPQAPQPLYTPVPATMRARVIRTGGGQVECFISCPDGRLVTCDRSCGIGPLTPNCPGDCECPGHEDNPNCRPPAPGGGWIIAAVTYAPIALRR